MFKEAMSPKTGLQLFLLFFVLCSNVAAIEIDLTPGISMCNHIAPSESQNYSIDIAPTISSASFVLSWSQPGSGLQMALR